MEPGYENVPTTRVTLTITEPFVVRPSYTVYILPTSKFLFNLDKVSMKNHEMQFFPIQLPSKQYIWSVDEEKKGLIYSDGTFISKDKEGYVGIHVEDN